MKNEKIIFLIFIPFIILGFYSIFSIEIKINELNKEKLIKQKIEVSKSENLIPDLSKANKVEIPITINDDSITPNKIIVKKDSLLIFKIKVIEGYHNLYIQDYEVKSKNFPTNKTGELMLFASQSGVFKLKSNTGKYISEPEAELIIE